MVFREKLIRYMRAGYTGLGIETTEEARVLDEIVSAASKFEDTKVLVWSLTRGLQESDTEGNLKPLDECDPYDLFKKVEAHGGNSLIVLRDFHPFLDEAIIVRGTRDALAWAKLTRTTFIFISAKLNLPPDLAADVHIIDFPLPTPAMLGDILTELLKTNPDKQKKVKGELMEAAVAAARGMTSVEAENVFALALGNGELDPMTIAAEKAQVIKRSGTLELYESLESMSDVGGLSELKDWLGKRQRAFSKEAKDFGLPTPRGILLLGVPGSGKSLVAKAVAQAWKKPLLRFDIGAIFGSLVGESEAAIRRGIQTAEAVAPCVLWIDEIEKAFAGSRSSGVTDSGVTARVFGTFLTWMQEKTSPVFVVATANSITALPPELLRKGRFDEIWFVDLPTEEERKAILNIHTKKRGRNIAEKDMPGLAMLTKDLSGAELEEAVISGLYQAFSEERDLDVQDIAKAVSETVPLSKTMEEEIDRLRTWAKNHARLASPEQEDKKQGKGRRLRT